MQAIVTEYRGPTNTRGSRIIVRAEAGRMTIPWDHALNPDENHRRAVETFARNWSWDGRWVCGHVWRGVVAVCVGGRHEGSLDVVFP